MVIGCYTLHLYCRHGRYSLADPGDTPTCKMPRASWDANSPAQFVGYDRKAARQNARAAGWTFNRDGDCECWWCSRYKK